MKNQMPAIGARVKYIGKAFMFQGCAGIVVAHYPGGDKSTDPETGEVYISPDSVAVKVDHPLPKLWPYIGTDRFAPDAEEVALIHPCHVCGEPVNCEESAIRKGKAMMHKHCFDNSIYALGMKAG